MSTETFQLSLVSSEKDRYLGENLLGTKKPLGIKEAVGETTYHFLRNEKASQSYCNHVVDFVEKDVGWRAFKTAENIAKLVTEAGFQVPQGLDKVASRSGDYWKWSAVAKAVPTTRAALKACDEVWNQKGVSNIPGEASYKLTRAWQKSLGAAAMWGYATGVVASCFSGGAALAARAVDAANVFDAGDNGINIYNSYQNLTCALEARDTAIKEGKTGEVQQRFTETARSRLLAIAKSVCSIAGFSLGLLVILGYSFVPPLAALTISLLGNLLAIWGAIYQSSMEFKEVQFFDQKHILQIQTA